MLDPDEALRVNRVYVARFYGKFPHEVDAIPEQDFNDTLQIIWADEQK